MNNQIVPQTIAFDNLVKTQNQEVTTTSKIVADTFKKQHKNVLAKIDEIIAETPTEFNELNFKPIEIDVKVGFGFRKERAYEMTKDGFMLLVMGFTGKKAMELKIRFIQAFNWAFEQLQKSDSQQRDVLRKACSKLSPHYGLIGEIYIMVGKQFGYDDGIKNIPTPLLPEATAFVYEMILRLNKTPQPTLTPEQTKSITRLIVEVWQLNTMTAGTFLQTVILYDRDKLDYYKGFYKGVHRACIDVVNSLGLKGSGNLPLITGRTVNSPSGVRFNVDIALI